TTARHTRPAHPPNAACRIFPRSCHREAHSANLGRTAPGRDRVVVSGTPPARSKGLDRGFLGAVGQAQTGQILPAHRPREKAARGRTIEVGSIFSRDWFGVESSRTGGEMNDFFRTLGWLARRAAKARELREELECHLAEEANEREATGLPEEQARRAARRDLGNFT